MKVSVRERTGCGSADRGRRNAARQWPRPYHWTAAFFQGSAGHGEACVTARTVTLQVQGERKLPRGRREKGREGGRQGGRETETERKRRSTHDHNAARGCKPQPCFTVLVSHAARAAPGAANGDSSCCARPSKHSCLWQKAGGMERSGYDAKFEPDLCRVRASE